MADTAQKVFEKGKSVAFRPSQELADGLNKFSADNKLVNKSDVIEKVLLTALANNVSSENTPQTTGLPQPVEAESQQLTEALEKVNAAEQQVVFLKNRVEELEKERDSLFDRAASLVFDPFGSMLQPEEYDALIKWDKEVLMPGLQQLVNDPELIYLFPRQKFLLCIDYVMRDPVMQILNILPGLTAEQRQQVEDLAFPNPGTFKKVYDEFLAEKDNILAFARAQKEKADELEKNKKLAETQPEQTTESSTTGTEQPNTTT